MVSEISAGIVVFRKKGDIVEYLLLHYKAGHWDFSKGHIEEKEGLKQAAIRELEEETGIKAQDFVPGFCEDITYFFQKGSQKIKKTVTFFLARVGDPRIRLSQEHKAYKWLPYNQAVRQATFGGARQILKKANRFIKNNN